MKYIGVSTPAYSIPSRRKYNNLEDHRTDTYRCGYKDISDAVKKFKSHNIEWSFPKKERTFPGSKPTGVPPVGSYELRKEPKEPKQEAKEEKNEPKKKMSGRDAIYRKEEGPDVGRYNLNFSYFNRTGFSMGHKKEDFNPASLTPGPGAYEIDPNSISKNQERGKNHQARKILRSKMNSRRAGRNSKEENLIDTTTRSLFLLPDSFDELRKCRSKSGTFSMAGLSKSVSRKPKTPKPTPGPGTYTVTIDFIKQQMENGKGQRLLGKYKPMHLTSDDTPGPGKYQIRAPPGDYMPKFSIPKSQKDRSSFISNKGIPGPGDYELPSQREQRSAAVPRERRDLDLSRDNSTKISPGPGDYEVIPKDNSGPKYSIRLKTHLHKAFQLTDRSVTVGPGCYDPEFNSAMAKTRTSMFPRSMRSTAERSNSANVPGVGDYVIEREGANLRTGFSFTTATRNPRKRLEVFPLPGPGAYNLKHTIPQLQKYEQDKLDLLGRKIAFQNN